MTPDSFVAWHQNFIEEKRRVEGAKKRQDGRLTGRQLFESDKSLANSDATLLADGRLRGK